MSLLSIAGWCATIVTTAYTMFGLPGQIKENYQRKSTEGLSISLFCFLFATFASWIFYGILLQNYFIIVPNVLGALFGIVILFQFFYYKR